MRLLLFVEGGGKAGSLYRLFGGPRTRRMFEGKVVAVGVDGSTFTEVCGERPLFLVALLMDGKAEEWTEFEVEDVEEALEWLWMWWMLRMELTEEDVDFRPRRPVVPAEEWR